MLGFDFELPAQFSGHRLETGLEHAAGEALERGSGADSIGRRVAQAEPGVNPITRGIFRVAFRAQAIKFLFLIGYIPIEFPFSIIGKGRARQAKTVERRKIFPAIAQKA